MLEFHRVYARWDDVLWVGVVEYAKRRELTNELSYVTLPVNRHREVCVVLPDKILCDYGPEHEHG